MYLTRKQNLRSRISQNTLRRLEECLEDYAELAGVSLTVYDGHNRRLAGTGAESAETDAAVQVRESPEDSCVLHGRIFFGIDPEKQYLLAADGTDERSASLGRLAARQLLRILEMNDAKKEMLRFLREYLLGQVPAESAWEEFNRMKLENAGKRMVLLVEGTKECAQDIRTVLPNLLAGGANDWIVPIRDCTIAVVREMGLEEGREELRNLANMLADTLNMETFSRVLVTAGAAAETLEELPRACQEALAAQKIAKIFYPSRSVVLYDELGLARLIYQIPPALCESFLNEMMGDFRPNEIEPETLHTVYQFFNNNLNLSETSRQLFIHRNTLVYRLEKLQKVMGLDVRQFEDAANFRVAMMVWDYLCHLREGKSRNQEKGD